MNIHFNNKHVFEELKRLSVFSTRMGSYMYGTTDEYSDTDILYVYIPTADENRSVFASHHQYQFHENGVDHIFTSIQNFIKNTLNGDSTINFEIINHNSLIGTKLDFLYEKRLGFHNYKIIRSYLGLARRDIKHISKGKDFRDKNKKLAHAIRGYAFCKAILEDTFETTISGKLLEKLKLVRTLDNDRTRHEIGKQYSEKISLLRDEINAKLDDCSLGFASYMNIVVMKIIDAQVNQLIIDNQQESDYFQYLKSMIYDEKENGLIYQR